jgi:hypothetical protein
MSAGITEGFWERYLDKGKCALNPAHEFYGSKERYEALPGNPKNGVCAWSPSPTPFPPLRPGSSWPSRLRPNSRWPWCIFLYAKIEHLAALAGEADILAVEMAVEERIRQIEMENRSPAFDDKERQRGQLAAASASYALAIYQQAVSLANTGQCVVRPSAPLPSWPGSIIAWKPTTPGRMASKALALLLAELARLLRAGLAGPHS